MGAAGGADDRGGGLERVLERNASPALAPEAWRSNLECLEEADELFAIRADGVPDVEA
jgi:hypothetical protein